jgi:hypothetical protein
VAGDLIVEHLDGETLVYDTDSNEAHALSGVGAAEFLAAEDEVSRREVLRKLALAGAAAAGTGALVRTIVAPAPAQAQSCLPDGNATCTHNVQCCSGCCCTDGFSAVCASGPACVALPGDFCVS